MAAVAAIGGLSPEILQSAQKQQYDLFAHALQFVPESNEALSFQTIYFSRSSSIQQQESQQRSLPKGQSPPANKNLAPLPQTANGYSLSQTGQSDGGGGWLRSELTLTGNQQKRGLLKKLQNSSHQLGDKDLKNTTITTTLKQSNKLSPIRGSRQPLTSEGGKRKLQSRQDQFNQVKDGFFQNKDQHPTGFQNTSTQVLPTVNNKNARSTSNLRADSLSNNSNGNQNIIQNIQNHYYYGHHNNQANNFDNGSHNNSQYEDEEFNGSMEQNPYAMGWANNVLKEQFSVALSRIDEKNGRKKWIIRKVKYDKLANQTHYSSSAFPLKRITAANITNGNNNFNGKKPTTETSHKENRNSQQKVKKNKSSSSSEIYLNLVIAKQKKIFMDSTPELIDFSELQSTMNLNPQYIAGNIISQTKNKFQNGKQQGSALNNSIDSLASMCISIVERAYQLPLFNRNFKYGIEKIAFLNKALLASI